MKLWTFGFPRATHVDVSGQTQKAGERNGSVLRFFRELSAMPDRDDPDCLTLDSIEEAVRCDHDLTIRKLREFGHRSPGLRGFSQPSQQDLGALTKAARRPRVVPADVIQGLQELGSGRRAKENLHRAFSDRSASASARIESRS